jgi:hypothetical protein
MDTAAALLARERRSEAPACRVGESSHVYDYRRFNTTAWKVGNFLRHGGVRGGVTVGVAAESNPKALLTVLGVGLLGATARLDPPASFGGRAVVAPLARVREFDLEPGAQRIAYGDDPDDPAVDHWEGGVWSENPTMPPETPAPETPLVTDGERTASQAAVLAGAREVAEQAALGEGTTACLRAAPSTPAAVAGALAPLSAGAELLFPGDDAVGDVAIGGTDPPEPRAVALPELSESP